MSWQRTFLIKNQYRKWDWEITYLVDGPSFKRWFRVGSKYWQWLRINEISVVEAETRDGLKAIWMKDQFKKTQLGINVKTSY